MQNKTGNMETMRAYKFRIYPALGQRESHAQGENVRPQQEAIPEELRTYLANTGEALNL